MPVGFESVRPSLGRADAQGIVISQLVQTYLAPARLIRMAPEQRRTRTD